MNDLPFPVFNNMLLFNEISFCLFLCSLLSYCFLSPCSNHNRAMPRSCYLCFQTAFKLQEICNTFCHAVSHTYQNIHRYSFYEMWSLLRYTFNVHPTSRRGNNNWTTKASNSKRKYTLCCHHGIGIK